jgi:hypothetical protein
MHQFSKKKVTKQIKTNIKKAECARHFFKIIQLILNF